MYLKYIYVLLLISGSVFAESSIDFEAVLTKALDNSPEVSAIHSKTKIRQADGIEIRTQQNPELSAEIRPYTTSAENLDTEYEISVAFPFRISDAGKRSVVANLIEQVTSVAEQQKLLEFSQKIRIIYCKIWLLQEAKRQLTRVIKHGAKIHAALKNYKQSGLYSKSNTQLVAAQLARIDADEIAINTEELKLRAELGLLTGLDVSEVNFKEHSILPILMVFDEDTIKNYPLLKNKELSSKLAIQEQALANLDSLSPIRPRVGFEHTSDGADRIIAGLSFDLPFFNRNQAEKMRSAANAASAQAELSFANSQVSLQIINSLKQSANDSLKQLEIYKKKVLPALSSALSATQVELKSGQATPTQIVQVLSELSLAQSRYIELWVTALAQRIELSMLLGIEV